MSNCLGKKGIISNLRTMCLSKHGLVKKKKKKKERKKERR